VIAQLRFVQPVIAVTSGVVRRARSSSVFLPALKRKPRIAARWILTAWTAQAALAVVILFLAFVHPHGRDAFLDAVGPRKSLGQHITGVFGGSSKSDAQRRRAALVLDALAACAGGGVFLLVLLAHLPAAVARADAESSRREREADALRRNSPLKSAELYRSALELTCHPAREAALLGRIRELDHDMAARNQDARNVATVREDPPATIREIPGDSRQAEAGQLVGGRYAITQRIGRGGYGVVYRATDSVLHRDVALKQLPLSGADDEVARFQREARVLAMLSHPHVVQIFDLVECDGHLWMAMELVERGDLAALLKQSGPLALADAVPLAARIADALEYAHARGIVHRDLKPANVLMADAHTPKVTDFGLAKIAAGTAHTLEGAVMGSPHYMSPEQADGNAVDHRTDIYALGIILHQMIAGSVPFTGELASVLAQHIRRPAPPLASRATREPVPPRLDEIVSRMLAKSPDERPARMADVASELAHISALVTTTSPSTPAR
jgi:hypothetical protein